MGVLEEAQQQAESAAATLIERKFKEPANLEVMFQKQRVSSYIVQACVCSLEADRLRLHFPIRVVAVVLQLVLSGWVLYSRPICFCCRCLTLCRCTLSFLALTYASYELRAIPDGIRSTLVCRVPDAVSYLWLGTYWYARYLARLCFRSASTSSATPVDASTTRASSKASGSSGSGSRGGGSSVSSSSSSSSSNGSSNSRSGSNNIVAATHSSSSSCM